MEASPRDGWLWGLADLSADTLNETPRKCDRRRRFALGVGLLLFAHCPADGRPLELEDVLRMQDIGAVKVDARGTRIAFELIPSATERRDFALAESRFAGSVYARTVGDRDPAHRLQPTTTAEGSWLGPFSPDGSKLVLFWREAATTRTGIYDFNTKNFRSFDLNPRVDFAESEPVWISDEELIYSTSTRESASTRVDFRRLAARKLSKAWEDAWTGQRATADVIAVPAAGEALASDGGALVRVNVRTGVSTTLAQGNYVNLVLSADRHFLAAAERGGFVHLSPDLGLYSGQGPYRFVPVTIELKAPFHVEALCKECDVLLSTLSWGRADHRLTFFARDLDKAWQDARFFLFDARKGRSFEVLHTGLDLVSQRERGEQPRPEFAVPFRDGVAVAARALADPNAKPAFSDRRFRDASGARLDWFLLTPDSRPRRLSGALTNVSPILLDVTNAGLIVEADDAVYLINESSKARRLSATSLEGLAPLITRGNESRPGPSRFLRAQAKGDKQPHLLIVQQTNARVIDLPVPSSQLEASTVSDNGETIVYHDVDHSGAASLEVVAAGKRENLWRINGHLSDIEPAREVRVSYKLADGSAMESCALLPPNWTSGQKPPVVLHLYPGAFTRCPHFYREGIANFYEPELLASLGYVVLFPSAPAEKLRGPRGPLSHWADLTVPALDALDNADYADSTRAGVFGLSYGAISTLALLTQTDRFKAAVASHGAANFSSHYGTLGLVRRMLPSELFAVGQSVSYESRGSFIWLGAAPWDAPDAYIRASPLFDVEAIHTPLLLMHSDLDWNYQMDQWDQMFTALFRLGREAEYVRYWGEGHGVTSPANVRDMWSRLGIWYGDRLKPSARSDREHKE